MKEKYKFYGVILILLFLLIVIVEPLWKLEILELGNASKFIKGKDNSVFMNINNMTSGDCAQDTFIIKNNLHFPFNVKLKCEKIIEDKNYNISLENLNIAIICEGKEVYKGLLSQIDKVNNNSYIDLGTYEANEEKNLNVKVYLNDYLGVDDLSINKLNIVFTTNNDTDVIFLEHKNDINSRIPKIKESHYIFLITLPIIIKVVCNTSKKGKETIC